MKNFLSIKDISKEKFYEIMDLAEKIKTRPDDYGETLRGKALAMIFQKSSTRTRVSFEVGMHQMGGYALFLSANDIQLRLGESLADTARVLSRYVNGIMARVYAHSDVTDLADYADVPVVNGLSDLLHPCQAMTDYFTIREHKGDLSKLKITYVGDGNNVVHSLLYGAARVNCNLTVITPRGFEPDPTIVEEASEESKGRIHVNHDLDDIKDSDVVYTDTWASMGQEARRQERIMHFQPYQVNAGLMKRAKSDAIFMHCLPAHRGEEVTDEVADSNQSVIFDQAENRLHVQKAILSMLMV